MADLPILFSAPMVRAILREIEQPGNGKTQTRRVLDMPPMTFDAVFNDDGVWHVGDALTGHRYAKLSVRYRVGDRLYVREAHHRTNDSPKSHLVGYDFADGSVTREDRHHVEGAGDVQFFRHSLGGWGGRLSRNYPAMHMPRWASRITLIVTDVRVQRLQEISEADAIAEGIERKTLCGIGEVWKHYLYPDGPVGWQNATQSFQSLWDSINAERGYGWDTNPWVAAYTFQPILGNIDHVESARPQSNRAGAAAW